MPIPIPIDLTMAAAPLGWSGTLPELCTLFEESISGLLDPTYLIGQSGGTMPTHDIGPWFHDATLDLSLPPAQRIQANSGWWFFDPVTGTYQPNEQGCPVGTVVLWGGTAGTIPGNWKICDGSELSRFQFQKLFNAIGETWGAGDGESTFNLPPSSVFFINAAGFVADERVPLTQLFQPDGTSTTNGQGVGAQGGAQQAALIQTSDMPPIQTTIYLAWPPYVGFFDPNKQTEADAPNLQPAGYGSPQAFQSEPVTDVYGNLLGANQQAVNIMPPFATAYFIIKWQ